MPEWDEGTASEGQDHEARRVASQWHYRTLGLAGSTILSAMAAVATTTAIQALVLGADGRNPAAVAISGATATGFAALLAFLSLMLIWSALFLWLSLGSNASLAAIVTTGLAPASVFAALTAVVLVAGLVSPFSLLTLGAYLLTAAGAIWLFGLYNRVLRVTGKDSADARVAPSAHSQEGLGGPPNRAGVGASPAQPKTRGDHRRTSNPYVPWKYQRQMERHIRSVFRGEEVYAEYSPDWLGGQRIDVAVPKHKLAFEYNGGQHYGVDGYWNKNETDFREQKRYDRKKKATLEERNWTLIAVPFWDRKLLSCAYIESRLRDKRVSLPFQKSP